VETYTLNNLEITVDRLDGFYSKGGVYLSSLMSDHGCRELLQMFVKIKNMSRLPVYLYLIQRL
jgi:hypothetical protein